MKIHVKKFDILIILFVTSMTLFSAYRIYMQPHDRIQVLIRGQDNEWIFPKEAETAVIVSGPLGNTIVKLHQNSAWVESSPCDNQNCVAAGSISRYGQWTACLPNNVLLIIKGEGNTDVDSISW
jgi:hypothetical protein